MGLQRVGHDLVTKQQQMTLVRRDLMLPVQQTRLLILLQTVEDLASYKQISHQS